jgi:hypothetical protein
MAQLPTYDITIDKQYAEDGQELGIDMIAFTSTPAIIVKGMAYNSQQKVFRFNDDVKQRITAPVMIPMEIYRRDEEDGYEYTTRFTAEVIEELHAKLMKDLHNKDLFNIDHNAENKVPAYILEAWIVESKEDKAYSKYNLDVPIGTLMMTAQVTDKEYYDELVKSDRVGFSIEGYLGMKLKEEFKKQYSMKLPDGEHLIEGKIYVVKDGEIIEIKEQEVQEEMAEEMPKEEEKKEEMAEEPAVEEEPAEEPAPAMNEEVKKYVDEKFDEVLKLIAELRAKEEIAEEEKEEIEEKTEMSAHQKLMAFMNFTTKK